MKWSWRIGRVAGIDVHVHATFVLLIAWVGLTYWVQDSSIAAAVSGVGFILALFACVLMHEFGHALTARKYGIRTREVTLLPIGGVARLERMPEDPRQELWVALAGPLVSIAISLALLLWLLLTAGPLSLRGFDLGSGDFVGRLMLANGFLALFNLIPAFPMDGGRVLRSLLAMWMDYARATQVAASMGQAMAFLFGLVGILANPFLLFIALFVWIGAAQEASTAQMRSALGGIPVSQAMVTEFHTLSPADPLWRAVEHVLAGAQQDFPVVEDDRVVGILTRNGLLLALAQQGQTALVGDVMQRQFQMIEASDMLETASARLQACECRTMPVTRYGELVGLITMDNLGEFLMIRRALDKARKGGHGPEAVARPKGAE